MDLARRHDRDGVLHDPLDPRQRRDRTAGHRVVVRHDPQPVDLVGDAGPVVDPAAVVPLRAGGLGAVVRVDRRGRDRQQPAARVQRRGQLTDERDPVGARGVPRAQRVGEREVLEVEVDAVVIVGLDERHDARDQGGAAGGIVEDLRELRGRARRHAVGDGGQHLHAGGAQLGQHRRLVDGVRRAGGAGLGLGDGRRHGVLRHVPERRHLAHEVGVGDGRAGAGARREPK